MKRGLKEQHNQEALERMSYNRFPDEKGTERFTFKVMLALLILLQPFPR